VGYQLAGPEHYQGRDGADLEALREPRCGVDVDLRQLELAAAIGGDPLEGGAHHPAGPAPGGPHVDQHRHRRMLDDVGEVVVAGVGEPGQRLGPVAAPRDAGGRVRHPLALLAVRAREDVRFLRSRGAHACAPACVPACAPVASWVMTRRSPSTSTRTTEPSISPSRSSARATRVSTSRAMNRRSGRAPYTGS